ncbi:uncharacterized protein LOC123890197 isoform X1 [Trifolium pratense]|uniref:Uncharacterized protein n=1 Tax=Trifolium pratense TaxID=57577 RepID=A0ACB0JT17_TRIPR|nr:uncharacterized protein LOC123890197 isoform X1 [Trifolium pratense]CAJ2647472.1 unnamed protein product [Trifolium pratense]
MVNVYSKISDVRVGKLPWLLKVRVMCLWIVKSNFIPGQENSIEMVLIDEKGSKIHATVQRHLIHLFKDILIEGKFFSAGFKSSCDAFVDHQVQSNIWPGQFN